MKPIIFNDGTAKIEVGLSFSNSFATIREIREGGAVTYINVDCIDKLIEALQKVKEELNHE